MNPNLLDILLNADIDELPSLIQQHKLDIATIQELKEYSAQYYASDPAEAVRVAEIAYHLGLLLPEPASALGRWTLANAMLYVNRYNEAIKLFTLARKEYLKIGKTLDMARMGVGYTIALAYIGQTEEAFALAAEIEPLLLQSSKSDPSDQWRLIGLFMNMGVIHELLGQFEEALAIYERQSELASQLDNALVLAKFKHNQACILVLMNTFDEAIPIFQEAESLFIQENAATELIRLYTNQASLYAALNRFEDVFITLDKAQQLAGTLEGVELQQHWLTLIRIMTNIEAQVPISEEIVQDLQNAQVAFTTHGEGYPEGMAWLMLGHCACERKEWDTASEAFHQARQVAESYADRTLSYRALHGLGRLAKMRGLIDNAIVAYESAIQEVESIRQVLTTETYRADFLTDKLAIYHDLAHLYLDSQEFERAFQIIERAKSRLLTEKLAFRLGLEAERLRATEDEKIRQLTESLTTALEYLDTLYHQTRLEQFESYDELFSQPSTDIVNKVAEQEDKIQTLTRQIQRHQPLLSMMATGESVSLAQLKKCLKDEIFLQYYVAHNRVGVIVINDTGIQGAYDLVTLNDVQNKYETLNRSVEQALQMPVQFGLARTLRYFPKLLNDAQEALFSLYQQLFQPIVHHFEVGTPVLISADGLLHYIPFHALYDGQEYLIEQRSVVYTPNATILDFCMQRRKHTGFNKRETTDIKSALLVGYDSSYLDAVSTEIHSLKDIFQGVHELIGADAITEEFLMHAPHFSILHLAMHAQFRVDNPMLSSLSMADRRLTLAEIARLQLDADLVTLSGCETGRGQLRGADLMSLAGGFMGAGARALLVSLWRIEDKVAAQFMQHFYTSLNTGHTKADAVRLAQTALLRSQHQGEPNQNIYIHPAYWSPFVLIGNWMSL